MRLKSALRRGVAAAVIAGIVVSSGIPAYAARWNIADGDITVRADEAEGTNRVSQGKNVDVKDTDTVITGKSEEHTVTIDTSGGKVDVTFDDLKIDVSGKTEGDGSDDSPVDAGKAAVTVKGDHDAAIELDGDNKLKSGGKNAGLEKNDERSEDGKTISGKLTIKDDKGKDGSLTAEGGEGGGAGIGGKHESGAGDIKITGGVVSVPALLSVSEPVSLPVSAAVCTAQATTSKFPAARCRPRAAMRMKICIPPAPVRLASVTARVRKAPARVREAR